MSYFIKKKKKKQRIEHCKIDRVHKQFDVSDIKLLPNMQIKRAKDRLLHAIPIYARWWLGDEHTWLYYMKFDKLYIFYMYAL